MGLPPTCAPLHHPRLRHLRLALPHRVSLPSLTTTTSHVPIYHPPRQPGSLGRLSPLSGWTTHTTSSPEVTAASGSTCVRHHDLLLLYRPSFGRQSLCCHLADALTASRSSYGHARASHFPILRCYTLCCSLPFVSVQRLPLSPAAFPSSNSNRLVFVFYVPIW